MVILEIIEVLDAMRHAYNSEDFDFTKWHSIPLLVIEDDSNEFILDSIIFERFFETLVNYNKYLDLPKIDFRLRHILMVSEKIAITSVVWEFFSAQQEVELILEIEHIVQKKDDVWKIIALIQPTWREPIRDSADVKMPRASGVDESLL